MFSELNNLEILKMVRMAKRMTQETMITLILIPWKTMEIISLQSNSRSDKRQNNQPYMNCKTNGKPLKSVWIQLLMRSTLSICTQRSLTLCCLDRVET